MLLLLLVLTGIASSNELLRSTIRNEVTLSALSNQITSRLPFKEVEKLVYSTVRRELLNPSNSSILPLFAKGSYRYYLYNLLQIDNQIQLYIQNDNNRTNYDQIQLLQQEFDKLILNIKISNTFSYDTHENITISDFEMSNKLRELDYLMLYDQLNKTKLHDTFEIMENLSHRLLWYSDPFRFYSIKKRMDHSKGMESNDDDKSRKETVISSISEDEINGKLLSETKSKMDLPVSSTLNTFNKNAIPYLLKQETLMEGKYYDEIVRKILMDLPEYVVLYLDTDECIDILIKAISHIDNRRKEMSKKQRVLQFMPVYRHMTIEQLSKMELIYPWMKSEVEYIEICLRKLAPIELSMYAGEKWDRDDIIPITSKWKYIKSLLIRNQ